MTKRNLLAKSYLYVLGYRNPVDIGKCFQYANHVKKNNKIARIFYGQAAKQGDPDAFFQLSLLANEEADDPNISAATREKYLGDSLYYSAIGYEIFKQWDKAKIAYEKAAKLNHAHAMYRLGKLYHMDRMSEQQQCIIKKDLSSELTWYRKATAAHSAHGLNSLLEMSDIEPQAAFILGQMYECGEIGNTKLITKAIEYYKKASKMRNKEAAYSLGILYEHGNDGLEIDFNKASSYYLKASELQHEQALAALERTIPQLADPELLLKIAAFLQKRVDKKLLALPCFKYLADIGYQSGLDYLHTLISKEPSYAYELGKVYEQDDKLDTASHYYLMAAKHGYEQALASAKSLVERLNNDHLTLQLGDIYQQQYHKNALALQYFKYLADKGNSLGTARLHTLAINDSECAYQLGRLYERGSHLDKHLQSASTYYLIAAKQRNRKALTALENLVQKIDDDSLMLELGDIYLQQFHKKKLAMQCFKYLADKGDSLGLARLKRLSSKDKSFAYRLGKAYELDTQINDHLANAWTYYMMAAKQQHEKALMALASLAKQLDNDQSYLELAEIYQAQSDRKLLALAYFKQLADKGNRLGLTRLTTLVNRDSECAYELGRAYELDIQATSHLQKACGYYAIAACNRQKAALSRLKLLANEGCPQAQYSLGCKYYYAKGKFTKAIHWCMLAADKQYSPAITYLNNATFEISYYLWIAKEYEQGNNVKKNIYSALNFYEKAYVLKNKDAAFRLGQLYQIDLDPPQLVKDNEKACQYFLKAAKYGHPDAVIPLDRLGQEVTPAMQVKLGDLYSHSLFKDQLKSVYWYQQALDGGNVLAQQRLTALLK